MSLFKHKMMQKSCDYCKNLHYSMFLFKHIEYNKLKDIEEIYITVCFYLNVEHTGKWTDSRLNLRYSMFLFKQHTKIHKEFF